MKKRLHSVTSLTLTLLSLTVSVGLSGCVTQNYADDAPVVDKDFSDAQLAKTRISLALSYLDMGNTSQAKYNLEKARQFAPELVDVYTAFAHYYESVGEYQQAEQSYRDALDINDDDADTLNNFGVFLCRRNRIDEAETFFSKAIKVPTYIRVSETYENIALCYLKQPQFDKAEDALSRSIMHSPNRASSLMQMAQLQYAKGDYDAAANFLSRFELATRRFTAQAIALSYKVQQRLGNDEVATNYATMLLNMFPDAPESKQYLSDELAHMGVDDLAKQYKEYRLLKMGVKVNKKTLLSLSNSNKKQFVVAGASGKPVTVKVTPKSPSQDRTNATQNLEKNSNANSAILPSVASNTVAAPSLAQPVTSHVSLSGDSDARVPTNTGATNPQDAEPSTTAAQSSQPRANSTTPVENSAKALANVAQSAPDTNVKTPAPATPTTKPVSTKPVESAQPEAPITVAAEPTDSSASLQKVRIVDMQNPVHVVQKGDNLYRISIRYNITIATLRRWNNLVSEEINVGQVLRLTKPK